MYKVFMITLISVLGFVAGALLVGSILGMLLGSSTHEGYHSINGGDRTGAAIIFGGLVVAYLLVRRYLNSLAKKRLSLEKS